MKTIYGKKQANNTLYEIKNVTIMCNVRCT